MNQPSARNPRTPALATRSAASNIGVSITNERGERYRYQANSVSLRMKRGVLQIIERERGCFAWFEGCNLEVRDRRRNVLFRLLAGSASSDGTDLTIIAEVARRPRGATAEGPAAFVPKRTPRAAQKSEALSDRPRPNEAA